MAWPSQIVCFRIGATDYAVDILAVKEVLEVLPITRLPRLPSFVEGVVELRGELLPVIDLRRCLGIDSPPPENARLLVARLAGRHAALVVDAVQTVERVDGAAAREAPELTRNAASAFFLGLVHADGASYALVDLDQILSPAQREALRAAPVALPEP